MPDFFSGACFVFYNVQAPFFVPSAKEKNTITLTFALRGQLNCRTRMSEFTEERSDPRRDNPSVPRRKSAVEQEGRADG